MPRTPITFFGSGPVAAKSLELLSKNFEIAAVVTKPKPEHHKGDFPVIALAEQMGVPMHTVSNKKELSELMAAQPFHTEVAVLIDFGIIVTQDVIDYFPKGIINSHFSLLPEWRGADPITFAILSGQKKTGVSFMLIDEGMDTGELIGQVVYQIPDGATTPELTDALIHLSDQGLKEFIPQWLNDEISARPQEDATIAPSKTPSYSRKLTKDDGILDFAQPAEVLEREIRAFIEWPKSRTTLADIDVIITSASVVNNSGKPGDFSIADKQLVLFCTEGSLQIHRLKPAGKGEMTAEAFIAGYSQRLK